MAREKGWFFRPVKRKVPASVKDRIMERMNHLVDSELRPRCVKPKSRTKELNYVVDIYSKCHRNCFYFCAKYRCPFPDRISDFFEVKFARMEYVGQNFFDLYYMRHTGQWWGLYSGISLKECLGRILKEPYFLP